MAGTMAKHKPINPILKQVLELGPPLAFFGIYMVIRDNSFITVVLPALGGETISPRCPRPIGQNRSINRHEGGHPGYSSVSRGCGSIEDNSSNFFRSL